MCKNVSCDVGLPVTLGNRNQVSISSTFYVQNFRTYAVSAAFSSCVLALSKNLYEKRSRMTLMKLTTRFNNVTVTRMSQPRLNHNLSLVTGNWSTELHL